MKFECLGAQVMRGIGMDFTLPNPGAPRLILRISDFEFLISRRQP
jgi:hypothetical protein